MNNDIHSYRVAEGHGLRHDPIPSIVGPRPIGWISTIDEAGTLNLAPYSFFNIVNYHPPIVAFSSVGRKDTVRNAAASLEFVCNLATRALAEKVNLTSRSVLPDADEFALAGLTPAASVVVRPPRVAESPAALECRVVKIEQLCGIDGILLDTWLVLGEVVAVTIDKAFLNNDLYDTGAARPILRAGGPADYFEVTPQSLFQMRRPD
ncbi:MAG: uncharacterized protein JWR51_89 [Devosia sp.]|uniref:flavin reductase family protein n=1 Tax=Devosia sp. TaxID=1871048 RepID=UPI00261448DF|nr:flavin reductase family protein [Devosia sp.]MDB5526986.1 uncharacterized protein [Devosia sp.]